MERAQAPPTSPEKGIAARHMYVCTGVVLVLRLLFATVLEALYTKANAVNITSRRRISQGWVSSSVAHRFYLVWNSPEWQWWI